MVCFMDKDLLQYRITHEKGGIHTVFAKDPSDAIDQFYNGIKSTIGHHLKICGCFGEEKPLDRSKIVRITKIEEVK